jgi:hypothetical protein
MNIRFNFEIEALKEGCEINAKGDSKIITEEIRRFVKGRLIVFKEEMNKYPNGYVLIDIGKPEIRYYYPNELALKLLSCVTEEDFKYITTKIYYLLNQQ